MKIVLNDVNDVEDFLKMLSPSYFRLIQKASTGMDALADNIAEPTTAAEYRERDIEGTRRQLAEGKISETFAAEKLAELADSDPQGLPTDIPAPLAAAMDAAVAETSAALRQEDELPERDADGAPHNTKWHSEPAKINADGRWRARRKRDEAAYAEWIAERAPCANTDSEPVATETHALPQDELQHSTDPEMDRALNADAAYLNAMGADAGPTLSDLEVAPTVDLAALVEVSQEAALDASDSHMDLIKACQAFISDHGHPAYNALKAAVAPLEGAENGKAVPQFTPGERRLMRACIDNYPTHKEA